MERRDAERAGLASTGSVLMKLENIEVLVDSDGKGKPAFVVLRRLSVG